LQSPALDPGPGGALVVQSILNIANRFGKVQAFLAGNG
jgi:hypothetical protein